MATTMPMQRPPPPPPPRPLSSSAGRQRYFLSNPPPPPPPPPHPSAAAGGTPSYGMNNSNCNDIDFSLSLSELESPGNNHGKRRAASSSSAVSSAKSVRKLPLENEPGSGSMMSQNETNSYRRTPSSNYNGNFNKANPPPPPPTSAKSPSVSAAVAAASPSPIASCWTQIDCLPDTVDKNGRCLKHQYVKLYKKKLLGGYGMLLLSCPNCEEEAPYESLWSSRAKKNKKDTNQPRELNNSTRSSSSARGVSRERSGSVDSSKFRSKSNERAPMRERSIDTASERRSRSMERRSRPNERRNSNSKFEEPTMSLPFVPNLPEGEGASDRRSPAMMFPPPPPLPPPPLQADEQVPSPRSRRRNSSDRTKSPMARVRSLSAGPASRSLSVCRLQRACSESSPRPESKSIFDKGIDKLSSLHNRARSASRSRRFSSSFSGHENDTVASSTIASSMYDGQGVASISERGLKLSRIPNKTSGTSSQSSMFDKKTGRCKTHPSVIIAKKAKFNSGWDVVRECPMCARGEEDDQCEFSKKKMNALLHRDGKQSSFHDDSTTRSPTKVSSDTKQDERPSSRQCYPPAPLAQDGDVGSPDSPARVSRMRYKTPQGESGWYTGQVNSSGQPHGKGRFRSKTGRQITCEWVDGYSEEFLDNRQRMERGFGTNMAAWKENNSMDASRSRSLSRQPSGEHPQAMQPPPGYSTPYGMVPYITAQQMGAMISSAGMLSSSPGYHQQPPLSSSPDDAHNMQAPGYQPYGSNYHNPHL